MCDAAGPILLVEDETSDAVLFERALRKAGSVARVIRVNDGDEAVAYLEGTGVYGDRGKYPTPGIIVLDIKLPRRSGLEVLQWIRSHKEVQLRSIPIVVVSSSNRVDDIDHAYEGGANAFVMKPYTLNEYVGMTNALSNFWMKYNEQSRCPIRHFVA
jgi:CheY-like chemotaxis protein